MTKIIILDNKKCQIVSDDEQLLKRLHRFLSYRIAGYEYTPAARSGGWDGITYLLSKTNKFNYGLLNKVKGFLTDNGHQYAVEDKRSPKTTSVELDISESLKKHGLIPKGSPN